MFTTTSRVETPIPVSTLRQGAQIIKIEFKETRTTKSVRPRPCHSSSSSVDATLELLAEPYFGWPDSTGEDGMDFDNVGFAIDFDDSDWDRMSVSSFPSVNGCSSDADLQWPDVEELD